MIALDRVAFTTASQGDLLRDLDARARVSQAVGIPAEWAVVRQIHGATVHRVSAPGLQGEGDAMWTDRPGVPLAVFTADCLGVVLLAEHAVGVAHAGWRGAAGGVVPALAKEMEAAGHVPSKALIGPRIGPCCFEVGPEVAEVFPGHTSRTTWDTPSVDLPGVIAAQLEGLELELSGGCTYHEDGWFSHRRNADRERQATLTWV